MESSYNNEDEFWAPPASTDRESPAPEPHRSNTVETGYTDNTVEERYIDRAFYRPLFKY